MTEPTVDELVSQLIVWARQREDHGHAESPVLRFERWIREDPERGWEVLRLLVARAPHDAEVMFLAAFRVPQLIRRDFTRFRDLVAALLKDSSCLDALVGPEVFIEGEYGPRYSEPEQLAGFWLRNVREGDRLSWFEQPARDDPRPRVQAALEVILRGPLRGFDSWDVHGPLLSVLREYGARLIEDIESAASQSLAVRRAIWSARHLNYADEFTRAVPTALWARFQAAAGGTNTCNCALPAGEMRPMTPEQEQWINAWFAHEETSWAWSEVYDLVQEDPEKAWRAVTAIVRAAESQEELAVCGAGPLESLIRAFPDQVVDRVEHLAGESAAFRAALASAWIKLEDIPDPLARRYFEASGRQLKVLDAPKDWPQVEDPGAQ